MKTMRKIRLSLVMFAIVASCTFTSCSALLQVLDALVTEQPQNNQNNTDGKTQDNTNNNTNNTTNGGKSGGKTGDN